MKLWYLVNQEKQIYAVTYADNSEEAVRKTCKEYDRISSGYVTPDEWVIAEFRQDTYGGVLIFN